MITGLVQNFCVYEFTLFLDRWDVFDTCSRLWGLECYQDFVHKCCTSLYATVVLPIIFAPFTKSLI